MSSITRRIVPLLAAATLLGTACGSDGSEATVGVASLTDTADAASTGDETADLSAEETALAFSECIRGEGIDFPDIGVDADGNIDLRDVFESGDLEPGSEEFQGAMEACGTLLEGTAFGGGRRAALGDNAELEDALVEYSDCIRDQGFDVGDLTFGGPGAGPGAGGDGEFTPPADGEGPPRGEGAGEEGFGDPSARFAEQLGLDPDDPDVAAALDECASIIDTAFSDTGFGPGADT